VPGATEGAAELAATAASFSPFDPTEQMMNQPVHGSATGQSVPAAQFNALLYQHNVLRQELSRVTDYLDGCDRLLGEMVRTIAALEERTQRLDAARSPGTRIPNPLAGALRTVTAGFRSAVFTRATKAPAKPAGAFLRGALAGR